MPNLIKIDGLPGKTELKLDALKLKTDLSVAQLTAGNAALSRYQTALTSMPLAKTDGEGTLHIFGGLEQCKFFQTTSAQMLADPNLPTEAKKMIEGAMQVWTRTALYGTTPYDLHRLPEGEVWPGMTQDRESFFTEAMLRPDGRGNMVVDLSFRDSWHSFQLTMSAEDAEAWGFTKDGIPVDPKDLEHVSFYLAPKVIDPAVMGAQAVFTNDTRPAINGNTPHMIDSSYLGIDATLSPAEFGSLTGRLPEGLHLKPIDDLHVTLASAQDLKPLFNSIKSELKAEGLKGKELEARTKHLLALRLEVAYQKVLGEHPELRGSNPVVTGIGRATHPQEGHTVYWAATEWRLGDAVRKELGLPPKDFHVTLASTAADEKGKVKDVHTDADGRPVRKINDFIPFGDVTLSARDRVVVDTARVELQSYADQYSMHGLAGRIQRGLDPAGMLAVSETRQKLEMIGSALGVTDNSQLVSLTNAFHTGDFWKNAQVLSSAKDPAAVTWIIAAYITNLEKGAESDLTDSGFVADYGRINRFLDQAVKDPQGWAQKAIAEIVGNAGKDVTILDGDVPFSTQDAHIPMAIMGYRYGITQDQDGLLFVGADKLDYSQLEKMGYEPSQVFERGRNSTYYTPTPPRTGGRVKVLGGGFAIVFGGDIELAKALARTAK